MTRINCAIPVYRLTNEHLLAEHREIARLPYCLKKAIETGSVRNIPESFRLGVGHVTFFLDKMMFTLKRYRALREECMRRGFLTNDYSMNWIAVPKEYMKDYVPTMDDEDILKNRIRQRIAESRKCVWHYYSHAISKEEAIDLLLKK